MLNWKKTILPMVLGAAIIVPTAAFATDQEDTNTVDNAKPKIFERFKERRKGEDHKKDNKAKWEEKRERLEERKAEMDKVVEEGNKYVPGISEQWNEANNKFKSIKEEMFQIKKDRWEANREIRDKQQEEIRAKFNEIKEQVDKGEITKEEARSKAEEIKKEFQNEMERSKGIHKENIDKWKEENEDKIEAAKSAREEMKNNWKAFEEAVNAKDETKIKNTFYEFMKSFNNRMDLMNERLEDMKAATSEN